MSDETRICIERPVYSKTQTLPLSVVNQKYTTVLSLSLSLSTSLISFWSENIDMSKKLWGDGGRGLGWKFFALHIFLKLSKPYNFYMKYFIYLLKNLYWKTKSCQNHNCMAFLRPAWLYPYIWNDGSALNKTVVVGAEKSLNAIKLAYSLG